jgi:hypothetical protein
MKLIVYRGLITSIKTYACPTWEFAEDTHLTKLQRLQNRFLRAVGNLDRPTASCDLHVTFKIPYVYDYIIKLCRRQAEVILNHQNPMYVQLDKEKPGVGNTRGLNLAAVKPMTFQVPKCRFGGFSKLRHSLLHRPALIKVSVYIRI